MDPKYDITELFNLIRLVCWKKGFTHIDGKSMLQLWETLDEAEGIDDFSLINRLGEDPERYIYVTFALKKPK